MAFTIIEPLTFSACLLPPPYLPPACPSLHPYFSTTTTSGKPFTFMQRIFYSSPLYFYLHALLCWRARTRTLFAHFCVCTHICAFLRCGALPLSCFTSFNYSVLMMNFLSSPLFLLFTPRGGQTGHAGVTDSGMDSEHFSVFF